MKKFFHTIFFGWMGWTTDIQIPMRKKSIICVAPHTSNWDFIIGILYRKSLGFHAYFLMKKSWFFWPFGLLLKRLGGIPIDRKHHNHLTDYLADIINNKEEIIIAITPEGTRSRTTCWKKGFYFIAYKAGIPIQLYSIDYPYKKIVCTCEIMPNGNLAEDFHTISDYYSSKAPFAKYPEKFAIDDTL